MYSILIIDDDSSIRWNLRKLLESKYKIYECSGIQDTLAFLETTTIDLCLLDVNLSDGNGYDLCKSIRVQYRMPILFVTVRDDTDSLAQGLLAGGDDYIIKPFSMYELELRIMAQLRRVNYEKEKNEFCLCCDSYRLNTQSHTLSKEEISIEITKTEYNILYMLMKNAGCMITREKMLFDLWDIHGIFVDSNTLSVHISRIRKKLSIGEQECPIETIYGLGYRWKGTKE